LIHFLKILKYQISQKSIQWELTVPCRQMEGQTDRDITKLIVAICNFANTPIKPSTMSLLAIEQSRDQGLNGRKM
jgi:hypothetical protein